MRSRHCHRLLRLARLLQEHYDIAHRRDGNSDIVDGDVCLHVVDGHDAQRHFNGWFGIGRRYARR